MAALSHWQLPAFRDLHLEDSSVFSIRETPTEVTFEMELVLNERHPRYRAPLDGQGHCYRRGRITFKNATDVRWTNKRVDVAPAGAGEAEGDLGKIDAFILDGATYKLRGPWGRLELGATAVQVDVW